MCESDGDSTFRQRKTIENTTSSSSTTTTTPQRPSSYSSGPRSAKFYNHVEPSSYGITSQHADGILAAVGIGLCLGLLTYISQLLGIPMMASFLIGTSVKMFLNREPPSPTAFYKSSIFGIVMGTVMHFVLIQYQISKEYATPMLVALSMMYWKLGPKAELWAPANNLAIYLATEPWRGQWQHYPWPYLVAPYLTGHVWIYVFAWYWSKLRRYVRAKLVTREFFAHESSDFMQSTSLLTEEQQEERLRQLFDRIDLDHNGRLDVHELQLAFRKALECDLSLDEARLIMKSTDTDGDETLDFYEFRSAMMDRIMPSSKRKVDKCE